MPRPPSGVPLSPQINRRQFMKTLLGTAASAAMPGLPKILDAAPGLPAAEVPEFVTDPKMLSGFSQGLTTQGGKFGQVWVDGDWPEIEGMSGKGLDNFIKRMGLDRASETLPAHIHESDKVGAYTWNKYTRQWHPTVAFPGQRPNSYSYRYLEPNSPIPENALPFDPDGAWGQMPYLNQEYDMFDSPADFGKQLLSDWRYHKEWEFRQDGPDKKEMHDPEYRDRYIRHATENRLAPGGRPETPKALMDSGLPTGNMAIPGADDAGHLPSVIGRLRRYQKPAATGIMSLAPALLAPQGEEQ